MNSSNKYLSFEEARNYVRNVNLKNSKSWKEWSKGTLERHSKRPTFIPSNPDIVYKDSGWNSWSDWIGTKLDNKFLSFEQAREYVRSLKLANTNQWIAYYQNKIPNLIMPDYIPWNPQTIYPDQWNGMKDWLGTQWMDFEAARDFARNLGLRGQVEWRLYCKGELNQYEPKPSNIPSTPEKIYGENEWLGFGDWLGTAKNCTTITKIIDSTKNIYHMSINVDNNDMLSDKSIIEYMKIQVIGSIFKKLTSDKKLKSVIELNLSYEEREEIESLFFHFREEPHTLNPAKKAFIGLIFLINVVYGLKEVITYSSIWKNITEYILKYSKVTTFFIDNYFISRKNPNNSLKEIIELACKMFNLRNDFDMKDEHQYIRNTILLQIGLLNNNFDHLKLWLSNYNTPVVIRQLLDSDSDNCSLEFSDAWRVIKHFRDNIINLEQAISIMKENVWFQHIDKAKLLNSSKQKIKNQNLFLDNDMQSVFYLNKINFIDGELIFTINARDIYSLNLGGFRYEIYVDGSLSGLLLADNSKRLILDSTIEINNPESNRIELEIRNEDDETVYRTEITLFDFSEQIILFDEDGLIYQNFYKKLNSHKKYHMLIDSDLDCEFNQSSQKEYFDGFATLVSDIGFNDNCIVSYAGDELFRLNFSEIVQKPTFIDNLILYIATETSLNMNHEYVFNIKELVINEHTDEEMIKNIPSDSKIVKWTYLGRYANCDEIINNSSITLKLSPEMIVFPKHTLLIRYKKHIFKKVVNCIFIEKYNLYRLFKIDSNDSCKIIDRASCLTKYDLKNNKFYLSDFKKHSHFYLKNKSSFYQIIKPNQIINLDKFYGFGETIFISEHMFNSSLINMFNYVDNDEYISLSKASTRSIEIHKKIPINTIFLLFDTSLNYHRYDFKNIDITNNKLEFDYEIISCMIIHGRSIIDCSCNEDLALQINQFDNIELVKNLLYSNYPFLSLKSSSLLKKFISKNLTDFFEIIYNEKVTLNGIDIDMNFDKFKILIEHTLYSFVFYPPENDEIIRKLIENSKAVLLLDTPVVLFNILKNTGYKTLIKYFLNMLDDCEMIDEMDYTFINSIITWLFNTPNVVGVQKHNLKVAMHYTNGPYYLKKALEKLNG